jgi:hypothetical protein
MAIRVQRSLRLDAKTKNELDRLTGARGEIFYDNTAKTLRVFDGNTAGGMELLKADLSNIAGSTGGGGGDVDFGNKNVVATSFEGDLTGDVTGTVSDISNHDLGDLGDVNVTGIQSGQVLYYTGSEWQATTLESTFNGGNVGGITNFLNALESSSTSTGGVVVSGGLGIGKNTRIGGSLFVTDKFTVAATTGNTEVSGTLRVGSTVEVRSQAELRFFDSDNTQYISLRSPTNVTTSLIFTLPATDGTSGQVLTTNGLGQLNWATVSGGGGGGGGGTTPPGGSNSQVQFNSNGEFAGDSDFTYDQLTNTITVGTVLADITGDLTGDVTGNVTGDVTGDVTGNVTGNVTGDVTSTGTSTFSDAEISGGSIDNTPVGATTANSGAFTTLTSNGATTFTNNTDSTSVATGAVKVSGGLGVALNTNVGGSMTVNNTITSNGNIVANSNVIINNTPTQSNHAANKSYVDSRALALSIALGG